MRINADHRSCDYWRVHFAACPVIRMDGVDLDFVIEADDVEGIVIVAVTGEDAKPLIDRASGRFVTRILAGQVEIFGSRLACRT